MLQGRAGSAASSQRVVSQPQTKTPARMGTSKMFNHINDDEAARAFQAEQDQMHEQEQQRENAKDVVRDWCATNPEANPDHYDNPTAVVEWERRATDAVLQAWADGTDPRAAVAALASF